LPVGEDSSELDGPKVCKHSAPVVSPVATGLGGVVSQLGRADWGYEYFVGAVGMTSKQVEARDVPRLGLDLDLETGYVDHCDGCFCADAPSVLAWERR
jgi:hypothetical protein